MKKLIMFLATEKGFVTLNALAGTRYAKHIGAVSSFSEISVAKDWMHDIKCLCQSSNIPFYPFETIKASMKPLIQSLGITGAIAMGWRYLLPLSMNCVLEDPLIIFHDSLLPQYRGFAPTPTAIIAGKREGG